VGGWQPVRLLLASSVPCCGERGVTMNPLPHRVPMDGRPTSERGGGPQAAPKTKTAYLSGSPLARESAPSLTK
jgi:hypothetical protein